MRYLSPSSCQWAKTATALRMQLRRPPSRVRITGFEFEKEGVDKCKTKDDKGRVFGWHHVCLDDPFLPSSDQQWRCSEHSKRLDLHVHRKMHETPGNVLWFLREWVGKIPQRQLTLLRELVLKWDWGHPKLMLQDFLKLRDRRVEQ